MGVCTFYQPGLLENSAFWIALGAAVFLASFSLKRNPDEEQMDEMDAMPVEAE